MRHRARQLSRHQPRAHSRPPQGILLVRFNCQVGLAAGGAAGLRHLLAAAQGGPAGGWRRRGTPPAVTLHAARRASRRDHHPRLAALPAEREQPAPAGGQRQRVARGQSRVRPFSRCAHAPSPSCMAATALVATSTSTPSAATARRCKASFCGTRSARPCASPASTSCAKSSWRPNYGHSWLISARLAWGSSWSRVTLNSTCWRLTSEASTIKERVAL